MALSGSTSKSYTPSGAFWTWVEWTATQDITNNTSTITAITYGGSNSYGYYSGTNKWGYTTIAGNTTSIKYTAPWAASTTKKELHRQVRTIAHNADGTKSVTLSGRWTAGSDPEGSFFDITSSGTFALDTIPRASTPTLSASTVALGSPVTISTNRASDSFTHVLRYAIGSQTGTIATGVGVSQSWSPPAALANAFPNGLSGVVTITCETYSGATLVGSKTVSLTVTIPAASPARDPYLPTVPLPTITEGATGLTAFTVRIQGKSKFRVQSSATPKYSATISQYKVVIDGATYYGADITSAIISKSGAVAVQLTVTDSRGLTVTVSVNVTVEAYEPPKINSFSAGRAPTDQGSDLSAPVNFSISPVANQNTKRYIVRYRPVGGSWTDVIDSTGYYSRSITHTAAGALDANISYEVELFISDYFGSASKVVPVKSAFELMNCNGSGRGIAFGKVSEMDAMEIAMALVLTGALSSDRFAFSERIQAGADLNTVRKPGLYYCPTNADARSLTNSPTASAFAMLVMTHAGCAQLVVPFGPSSHAVHHRNYYTGTWGTWANIGL